MVFFYESVGLEDIVREGFRVVFVQGNQTVGLEDVAVSTRGALLHISETKKKISENGCLTGLQGRGWGFLDDSQGGGRWLLLSKCLHSLSLE